MVLSRSSIDTVVVFVVNAAVGVGKFEGLLEFDLIPSSVPQPNYERYSLILSELAS